MADVRRPRTIRDIAHIYLSRCSDPAKAPTVNLFVAAQNTDCLSGFHVANLAAAFSHRKARVRLFELSGLLPNAAFYFSYHPSVYMKAPGSPDRELCPALESISITFDSIRLMGDRPATGELHVNLVHIPPVDGRDDYAEILATLKGRCSSERWVLYLTRDPGYVQNELFETALEASGIFALSLQKNGSAPPGGVENRLGNIGRWENAVDDRVPTVVRNPNSSLSRDYLSVCESVLGQIDLMRRRRHVERSLDGQRVGTAGQ